MPNWIAITNDTLNEAKIAAIITAGSNAALAVDQPARVAGLIQGVVDEIRRKVGSCPNNQVDADPTKIPKGLRDMAVDMIIARLKNAVEMELTEDERAALRRHATNLDRIAECKDAVDQPDSPVQPEVSGGPAAELVRRPRENPYCGF